MPELRTDPLTGERVIVAAERATRPGGQLRAEPAPPLDPAADPFAQGHEDRTPPEVFALRPAGGRPDAPGWTVRVGPNPYPGLGADAAEPPAEANRDLFGAAAARGGHEVIINGPESVTTVLELAPEQLATAMDVWRMRMRAHAGASYVHVIVNERREAGASLSHTHAQLYALPFVPAAVARERERFGAHATRTMGGNLLADLLQEEVRMRDRIVAIYDEAVLLAPYASRMPFQLMLV